MTHAVPPPQGMSWQEGLEHLLSPPAQHRLGDVTQKSGANAGALAASSVKLVWQLIPRYFKKKTLVPRIRVKETEAL